MQQENERGVSVHLEEEEEEEEEEHGEFSAEVRTRGRGTSARSEETGNVTSAAACVTLYPSPFPATR